MIRWPGHIPAGVVTQEMFSAVDWLPTFAGLVGASNLVPKDRPIDGIDASNFVLGKSPSTGRDSLLYFGTDGKLMAVKWKMYKAIFRYSEAFDKPIVEPQVPLMYDLSSDPHEDVNLFTANLTNLWMFGPIVRIIGAFEKSVAQYPNIKPGEDFKGYR
jgi:arylsulfatase